MSIFDSEIVKQAQWRTENERKQSRKNYLDGIHTVETKYAVINNMYGGFVLSQACISKLLEMGCTQEEIKNFDFSNRDDFRLVSAVRLLGAKANGDVYNFKMDLRVASFPLHSTEQFVIGHYDGIECIMIKHKKPNELGICPVIRTISFI